MATRGMTQLLLHSRVIYLKETTAEKDDLVIK